MRGSKRHLVGPVCRAMLLGAALLVGAPIRSGAEVIWRGDFETGDTSQWRSTPKAAGIKVVDEPVREGKYALRIDGTDAAKRGTLDRIEFQHQPAPSGTAEGTERYFGWSVFVPQKLGDDYHSVGYFESRNSWRQLMSFEVKGLDIEYTTRVPYKKHWSGKGRFTPDVWHDFVVHVLWSRDAAKGFVEVRFDGEIVVPKTMTATLRDENAAFLHVGFMRNTSATPETVYIDHIVEGTTLEDVTPAKRETLTDTQLSRLSEQYRKDQTAYLAFNRKPDADGDELTKLRAAVGRRTNRLLTFLVAGGTTEAEVRRVLGGPIVVLNPDPIEGTKTDKLLLYLGPQDAVFYGVHCDHEAPGKVSKFHGMVGLDMGL